jgi:DMSO/TMAO reductase YedYZ molybdopterin-dependent catalytic subunit
MATLTPGFFGRRREHNPALPPGQYLETGFPVLSAGPTPRVTQEQWEFTLTTEAGVAKTWNWQQMLDLGVEDIHTDIHCVTSWTKLGTSWRGVSLDKFFAQVETSAGYFMAGSYGGYTTNLPMEDATDGKAWIAFEFDGEDLAPEHGGPARLLVPHLYFWKSAKWVNSLTMMATDEPGFWEQNGYNMHGDPWLEERYW